LTTCHFRAAIRVTTVTASGKQGYLLGHFVLGDLQSNWCFLGLYGSPTVGAALCANHASCRVFTNCLRGRSPLVLSLPLSASLCSQTSGMEFSVGNSRTIGTSVPKFFESYLLRRWDFAPGFSIGITMGNQRGSTNLGHNNQQSTGDFARVLALRFRDKTKQRECVRCDGTRSGRSACTVGNNAHRREKNFPKNRQQQQFNGNVRQYLSRA
jgi:hypothetical protein